MADRYWVGGSGNWDASSTANWSTSSGGSAGASAPTSADNVIFDANSNTGTSAFTVTIAAAVSCLNFTASGLDGVMTVESSSTNVALDVYGSMSLPATNLNWSPASGITLTFRGTSSNTITTNGVTLNTTSLLIDAVGGTLTLGSALTLNSTRGVGITNGTFSTSASNYTLSVGTLSSSNSNTRTINLNASAVTLNSSTAISISTITNLTFNAGTSTITCSNASPTFTSGGLTFYDVTFSSAASGTTTINGANTFNNLTQTSRSATGIRVLVFGDNQTVSGTLTIGAANTAIRRILVHSSVTGTRRTITLNGTLATLADVDFRDIGAAGTVATPWTGTRLGNGLNNNNITFDAPKTVYWNLSGTQNWSATGWATTNNGTPAANNFPLAQDTAVFTEAGAAGTVTIESGWWIGEIQMADGVSNRTTAFTLTITSGAINVYKNVTLFSSLTASGAGTLIFRGQSTTQIFTSAGVSLTCGFTVDAVSGTFQLADNLTNTGTAFTLTSGTLDLSSGNRTLTCVTFSSSNSNTRSISFGTGKIVLTGTTGTVLSMSTATNFTYTGTSRIDITASGSGRTITPPATNAVESNAMSIYVTTGTDTLTVNGAARFLDFDVTGFTGTLTYASSSRYFGNLVFSSGMTLGSVPGFTFAKTSGTQTITSAGKTIDGSVTIEAPGATVQLQDNLTLGSTRTFTLTEGTLDLSSGNRTLSTGLFASSVSTTRAIVFGTGNITVTGNNATVWGCATLTNFSYTGTPTVNFTYSGSTGTRTIQNGSAGGTETNAVSMNISAGTDIISYSANSVFKNLSYTGFAGTSNLSGGNIYGNLTLAIGMTISASGSNGAVFAATSGTQTITSNGVTIDRPVTINAPGATVQLQDALALGSTRTLTLTAGTLNANNQNCTTGLFASSNTNVRTLTMGSGTWTIQGAGTAWDITDPTNLTLNSNTSSIVMTGTGATTTFSGGGLTYYNLSAPNNLYQISLRPANNTFNNLTSTNTTAGEKRFSIEGNQTINGTLTVTGSAGNCRIVLLSSVLGTPIIVTAGAVSLTDADFRDIDAAGAAIPWTGTRLGNCGGNSDITFAAPKTVYWNKVAGGNWSDDAWATSSGGATATTNQPLPQDTAIFDDVGINAGSTVSFFAAEQTGAWDCSALTNAVTFDFQMTFGGFNFYGDVTLSSSSSIITSTASTSRVGLSKRSGTQAITSSGVSWGIGLAFQASTLQLVDNLTTAQTTDLNFFTLDLNGNTLTCDVFSSSNTNTRSVAFNSGDIAVTGNNKTVWACADLTNFSYTGTPTVNFTYSGGTGTRTSQNGNTAGATELNVVDFNCTAGTDTFTFTIASSVRNLNYTGFSGLGTTIINGFIYGNLTLSATQTINSSTSSTTFAATSGTKTITTNGVTIDRPLTFNGVGGTWTLQDALTMGSTTALTITNGTFNANNYNITCGSVALGSGTKTITMGSGTWTIQGSGWDALTNNAGLTLNSNTSTISLTSASTKTFAGAGATYYNLNQGGAGTLTISGSNTFNTISNTTQPATVKFTNGTTQTVNNFNLSGTSGNLVTINSASPGSQFTLAKNTGGKVLVSYLSITDSVTTPNGYWFAPTSQGNVNGGNNVGWNFVSAGLTGSFLLM